MLRFNCSYKKPLFLKAKCLVCFFMYLFNWNLIDTYHFAIIANQPDRHFTNQLANHQSATIEFHLQYTISKISNRLEANHEENISSSYFDHVKRYFVIVNLKHYPHGYVWGQWAVKNVILGIPDKCTNSRVKKNVNNSG